MSMEDILKVLVDSRQQGHAPVNPNQKNNDPMADLIGGLLGGGQPSNQSAQQPAGLGSMMGLLETVMGGQSNSSSASANDPIMILLQPFVAPLAKKANISPELAMIIVSFVVHKLLSHHPTSGRDSNSFDLDEMLGQLNTGQVSSGLLQSSGMVKELSQKTGLNETETEQALGLALNLVGKTVTTMADNKSSKPVKSGGVKSAGMKKAGRINRSNQ